MFREIIHSVRLADLLDVLLLAAFLSVLLAWLRRSMSRNASVAAAFFGVIYVLVRLLHLYMVEMVIRGLFIIFLLAVVVVFQSDIRRMVERIGMWASGSATRKGGSFPTVDLLTTAAVKMSESHTGALIAVRGREPWDRLIEGGVEQGGKASLPLLYSLFSPVSPGHDGAVLMEGERLVRFAAHLPLSTNLEEVGAHGTRHTAALGLAEQCDAFVIVVSEEHGTISVAENSRLTPLSSSGELKKRLSAFWQQQYTPSPAPLFAWWNRRNLQTVLLSIVLSSLSWFLFVYQPGSLLRTMMVPIELRDLPERWALEEIFPTEAHLTLSGSAAAFRLLDASRLTVSLDLSTVKDGSNVFVIDERDLRLPAGIALYRVEPPEVQLKAQQLRAVDVPVQVATTGALPDSLELVALIPTVKMVTVMVPDGADPESVQTEPIDLSGLSGSPTLRVRLVLPAVGRLPTGQSLDVAVQVQTRPKKP